MAGKIFYSIALCVSNKRYNNNKFMQLKSTLVAIFALFILTFFLNACSDLSKQIQGSQDQISDISLENVRQMLINDLPGTTDESQPDFSYIGAVGGFALRLGEDSIIVYEFASVESIETAKEQNLSISEQWITNKNYVLDTSIINAKESFIRLDL